jgi:hypothetical protein
MKMPEIRKRMIEQFQCPGCVCGTNTSSGCYKPDPTGFRCIEHVAGTIVSGIGTINLGLPRGFNRVTKNPGRENRSNIRLYENLQDHPGYNFLNIPVWAMETTEKGMNILIVRCYMPRINHDFVDIILNGRLEDLKKDHPNVYDVSQFIEEID